MTAWSRLNIFRRGGAAPKPISVPNTLYGYFELRADRIVGWVQDAHGSKAATMQIEIFLRGSLIASFAATKQPEQRPFVFSFPVENRFTAAELVKEEVFIRARDSDGNNGRMLLDGATQLELARETLGVPTVVIFDLDFSRGGNARPYLGAGWSGTEADFTWTENDDSFVNFDTPAEPGTYVLRMTAGAVVRKPELPEQDLALFIDATPIAQITQTEPHAQFQECKFEHQAFAGGPRATLRLHHPGAVRPSDLAPTTDTRRLAFGFKRLTLARLLDPE